MGIEIGSIGAGIGSIGGAVAEVGAGAAAVSGPALNFEGPTFAAAPVLGSISQFGPKLEAVVLPFIDSPISKGEIFNMVPYKINPIFESPAVVEPILDAPAFTPAAAITESVAPILQPTPIASGQAESWLFNAKDQDEKPKQPTLLFQTQPVEAILAATDSQPKTETNPVTSQAEATDAPGSGAVYQTVLEEQVVEQAVRPPAEEVIEKREEEDPETKQQEDVKELTVKYVEAEAVTKARIYQLGQSIDQADVAAKAQGAEVIAGNFLEQFFVPQDSSNISPIANPQIGDGGLEKIYQFLSSKDYSSASEAKQQAGVAVESFKAVKESSGEGKMVKGTDVATAKKDPVVTSYPVQRVVERIIKITEVEVKTGQVKSEATTAVKQEEPSQGKIDDFPKLAEVFPKAA